MQILYNKRKGQLCNIKFLKDMNKAGIVDAVYSKLGGSKKSAEDAVDAVFDTIMQALGRGEEVLVSGFGLFFIKKRTARAGVNPRTGQKIQIAETVTPKFRAGKGLKAAVK